MRNYFACLYGTSLIYTQLLMRFCSDDKNNNVMTTNSILTRCFYCEIHRGFSPIHLKSLKYSLWSVDVANSHLNGWIHLQLKEISAVL